MGQHTIYNFLKQNKKIKFVTKQIAKFTNTNLKSCNTCLKKLRDKKEICFKYINNMDDNNTEKNKWFFVYWVE